MGVRSTLVTLTATPTMIQTSEADNVVGKSVIFYIPLDGQTVKLGGPDLTWANGFPLQPGTYFPIDYDSGEAVYGMVENGTQVVPCMWRGV